MIDTSIQSTSYPVSVGVDAVRCGSMMCRSTGDISSSTGASARLRRAERLLASHDLTAAISEFSQTLLTVPDSVEALLGRAKAFAAVNSLELSRRDVVRAITLATDSAEALGLRAQIYWKMANLRSGRRDVLLTLALSDASEAIRIDPACETACEVRTNVYGSLDGDAIFRYRRRSAVKSAEMASSAFSGHGNHGELGVDR